MGSSLVGDKRNLLGQVDAEAGTNRSHGQMRDIIASELQGGLAADARLGILRERSEAVDFFKDAQIALGAFDGFEATEVLIVLVKAADD